MKRSIVLAVSIALGVVAAALTQLYISAKDAEVRAQKESINKRYGTIEVLVYAKDIPMGTVLATGDLEIRVAPKLGLRGQAVPQGNLRDVIGRKVLLSHEAGEVVFWSDIDGGNPEMNQYDDLIEIRLNADFRPI